MFNVLPILLILFSWTTAQNPFLSAEEDVWPPEADTVIFPLENAIFPEPGADSSADSILPTVFDSSGIAVPGVEGSALDTSQSQVTPMVPPAGDVSAAETGPNPFLSQPATSAEIVTPTGTVFDMQIGIERGILLSRLTTKPDYIETQGKTGYTFELGVDFPFKDYFFAGVALRYYQVEYFLQDSLPSAFGGSYRTKTTETLNFFSLPIDMGIKYDFGFISPNLFIQAAPAVFVSGYYFAETKRFTVFPDKASLTQNEIIDQDVSDERGRFQLIYGGGGGLDVPYGYGTIFLKAGFDFFAFDLGDNEGNTRPVHSSSRLMVFFFSLGLKFYL